MDEKKEIKVVKSYSLPPSQIAWLRETARQESTPERTISASAVLERIIDEAMKQAESLSPTPSGQPKRRKTDARSTPARMAVLAA